MKTNFLDKNFPRPLSAKDTLKYFEKLKKGDKKARNKLIEHNIRLVGYRVNKRFSSVPIDEDELTSVGIMGLIKAVDSFDYSKNIAFATYSTKCIDNEILMFINKNKKHFYNVSFQDVIIEGNGDNDLTIEDTLEDVSVHFVSDYELQETYVETREIVEQLKDRDKEIIKLHFGFYDNREYTETEIGEKLGISQSYVSRIIKKILPSLEKIIVDNEDKITKTDCEEMLESIKAPEFTQMMNLFGLKESIVIFLKLGYINNKCYSNESISNFLGIDAKEIREITSKFLLNYKKHVSKSINEVSNVEKRKVKDLNCSKY